MGLYYYMCTLPHTLINTRTHTFTTTHTLHILQVVIGGITTGASDDLKRVTQMAYQMVQVFGMNEKIGQLGELARLCMVYI